MKKLLLLLIALLAPCVAQAAAPVIFFTDLDSGPNTGNTDSSFFASGNGVYVTIYGNFFGSPQGTSTVTWNGQNCLNVLPSTGGYTGWGMTYLWYQKIIVQIGSTCTTGTGQFVVTVGGQVSSCGDTVTGSTGCLFTVRSNGSIFYAATTGNDTTGTGTFNAPWGSISKGLGSLTPGDTFYPRNGLEQTGVSSFSDVLNWSVQGIALNPVAMVAYPGATAKVTATTTDHDVRCASGFTTTNCQFSTIAGMTLLNVNGTFALAIQNSVSVNWRIIANDMSCPHENGQDGCFHASQGDGPWFFFGNYSHDMSSLNAGPTSSKQSHSVYFTTDANHAFIGWNKWFNNYTCRDLQFHSSPLGGTTGQDQFDLHVYNNFFDGQRCNAINFATVDPSKGVVEAFNNLIINVGRGPASNDGDSEAYAAIYNPDITNVGTAGTGTISVYNNTFWNDSTQNPFGTTGILETNGANMTMNDVNNIVFANTGVAYVSRQGGGIMTGSNNLWFGNGASPTGFTSNVNLDPLFVNTATKDFHLQASSPALGAGVTKTTYDNDGKIRPNPPAIGSFELAGAAPPPPPPPTIVPAPTTVLFALLCW